MCVSWSSWCRKSFRNSIFGDYKKCTARLERLPYMTYCSFRKHKEVVAILCIEEYFYARPVQTLGIQNTTSHVIQAELEIKDLGKVELNMTRAALLSRKFIVYNKEQSSRVNRHQLETGLGFSWREFVIDVNISGTQRYIFKCGILTSVFRERNQ